MTCKKTVAFNTIRRRFFRPAVDDEVKKRHIRNRLKAGKFANKVLAALLAHWKVDRPKIACHDFGGATALHAHLINGCDYDKLLLFDPVAIRPWGSPFVQHVKNHEVAFAGVPDYIQRAIQRR